MSKKLSLSQSIVMMKVKPIPKSHWKKVKQTMLKVERSSEALNNSLALSNATLHKGFSI
jgi:hypothetical protein